ncbi:hypothetical protein K461DRAFT_265262 [Myriangium duriaei CBS 260.36]|uniref:Rhodopsin domain-containing protein n=1 Tax=Myriangium duriaei CBS 260.36 TaxID=1168546 RepID=A0A9P4MJW8_9PEZI|nr:hypothetical protein K461DRAFT_265262 [Myriangium duriaei CBS 260.36]
MNSTQDPTADPSANGPPPEDLPYGFPDIPYFTHPDVHLPFYISMNILVLVLTTLCLGLRIYVRRFMMRAMGWDDYVLMVSYLFLIVLIGGLIAMAVYIHNHNAAAIIFNVVTATQFWVLVFGVNTALVRVAIALFFLRVLPKYEYRAHRLILHILTWTFAAFIIAISFMGLFQCGNPLHWGPSTNPATCPIPASTSKRISLSSRVFVLTIDWTMTLMPLHVIWKSSMPRRSKISTLLVLLLGSCGSIICIVRIPLAWLGEMQTPHDLYNYLLYFLLAASENTVGIMAISLAACRPLLEKLTTGKKDVEEQGFSGTVNQRHGNGNESKGPDDDNVVFLTDFKVPNEG